MVLNKIKYYIDIFKQQLKRTANLPLAPEWASQHIFQLNWDTEARDFGKMYDQSLQNSQSRRLWSAEQHEPKRVMQVFIATQPYFVADMFRDLFDENKAIDRRADRFLFHCDELLADYQEANAHQPKVMNSHYHNLSVVSLYLAFRFPEKYALYDFAMFQKAMSLLEAKDVPVVDDFGRFVKSSKILFKLLIQDEDLMKLHRARLDAKQHYENASLLLVSDFYKVMSNNL